MDADGTVTLDGRTGGRAYAPPAADDVALILHTSGSTGRPKRVPLKHANLAISARNVAQSYELTADDVIVATGSAPNVPPIEGLDGVTVWTNRDTYTTAELPDRAVIVRGTAVGVETPGPKALDMLDLSRPDLDFVSLATGMGVPATRATTAEEFTEQLERSLAEPGPSLIEAMIPSM